MWFDDDKTGFSDDSQVGNAMFVFALVFCAALVIYLSLGAV